LPFIGVYGTPNVKKSTLPWFWSDGTHMVIPITMANSIKQSRLLTLTAVDAC